MMKQNLIYVCFLLSLSCSNAFAQLQAFDIDASHSKVSFTVSLAGLVDVDGTFTDYWGTILYDEQDLSKLSVSAFIQVATIHTGVEQRDAHLQKEDFFDAEKYPNIEFRSNHVRKSGKKWLMNGTLKMKGVEKQIEFPIQKVHGRTGDPWDNPRITFTAELPIKRSDFGIGADDFWGSSIKNEVIIKLTISGRIFNTDLMSVFEEGKPGKDLYDIIVDKGIETGIQKIEAMKKASADFLTKSSNLDWIGKRLIQYKMPDKAVKVLEINATLFPNEARVQSSLAYAYYLTNNKTSTKIAVQNTLRLDKEDTMALELQRITGSPN